MAESEGELKSLLMKVKVESEKVKAQHSENMRLISSTLETFQLLIPSSAGDVETQVRSLGWEGPLEKEMSTHSSILAWEIPWTEEPGGL